MQALTLDRIASFVLGSAAALCIAASTAAQAPGEVNLKSCVVAANESQQDRDDGRLREARRKMVLCASDACPANLRKDCREWLADVDARLPTIVVRVVDEAERDRTDVTVRLDGVPIALDGRAVPLNPGQHVIEVEAEGAEPIHQVLLAAEREIARIIRIRLQPTAAHEQGPELLSRSVSTDERTTAPPSATPESTFRVPTAAWVLGGVGVAALGAFAYFGISASNEHDTLAQRCGPLCSRDDTRNGRAEALVADFSLGVGLAALAGGVIWTLVGQERPESRASGLHIGAGLTSRGVTGSLQGRF
ncbi:MAG: hypothetical protein ABW321_31440 [Polyangiales bacterium]